MPRWQLLNTRAHGRSSGLMPSRWRGLAGRCAAGALMGFNAAYSKVDSLLADLRARWQRIAGSVRAVLFEVERQQIPASHRERLEHERECLHRAPLRIKWIGSWMHCSSARVAMAELLGYRSHGEDWELLAPSGSPCQLRARGPRRRAWWRGGCGCWRGAGGGVGSQLPTATPEAPSPRCAADPGRWRRAHQ